MDIGDKVQKGDVLADLFVPELREDFGTKKATVQFDKDRVRLAQKQVEVAAAEVKAARARLEEARSILGKYESEVERWDVQVKRLTREVETDRGRPPDPPGVDQSVEVEHRRAGRRQGGDREGGGGAARRRGQAGEGRGQRRGRPLRPGASPRARRGGSRRGSATSSCSRPYDGIVVARNANTWDFVLPTTGDPTAMDRAPDLSPSGKAAPIYVVDRTDIIRIYVNIPERDANYVHIGSEARVKIWAYRDEWLPAAVTRLSWALNTKSRTMRAEIDMPNPGSQILPGMYAYGEVNVERPDVRALPKSALTHAGGKSFIWRYVDGHAERTEIQTGTDGRRVDRGHQSPHQDASPPRRGSSGCRSRPRMQVLMGSKLSTLTEGAPVRLADSPAPTDGGESGEDVRARREPARRPALVREATVPGHARCITITSGSTGRDDRWNRETSRNTTRRGSDSPGDRERTRETGPEAPQVIGTDAPLISKGAASSPTGRASPIGTWSSRRAGSASRTRRSVRTSSWSPSNPTDRRRAAPTPGTGRKQ